MSRHTSQSKNFYVNSDWIDTEFYFSFIQLKKKKKKRKKGGDII